jgi:hypothetical protein
MVVRHQKTRRRTLEHLRKKDIQETSIKDSCRAAKEAEHQIVVEVVTEAFTHSNLHIACSITVKSITASKIAPFFLSRKER